MERNDGKWTAFNFRRRSGVTFFVSAGPLPDSPGGIRFATKVDMKNRKNRFLPLLLLSLTVLFQTHARASGAKRSFADVLEKLQDGKSYLIRADLFNMAPDLTDRQKKQVRKAVRSVEDATALDFSLLYMTGLAESSDITDLTILFCDQFVRMGSTLGPELLSDMFPSLPNLAFEADLEHQDLDRDALTKLHDSYVQGDKTVVDAIDKAEAKTLRPLLPDQNKEFVKLFFERLKKEGFRHYLDKCNEFLN